MPFEFQRKAMPILGLHIPLPPVDEGGGFCEAKDGGRDTADFGFRERQAESAWPWFIRKPGTTYVK